jgi:hypothetical protein
MISLRIRGGQEAADRFLTTTRLFTLAESLGGVESLAEHPAQMTHGSIPAEDRELLGIGDNLVRLSVGVEEEDLVDDVLQAVRAATGTSSQTFLIRNVDNDTQFVHFFLLHFSISLCPIIKLHRYEVLFYHVLEIGREEGCFGLRSALNKALTKIKILTS